MATETEVGLRVEDFMGVNAQVSSEDLQDFFYTRTQNLWERKLGEVQRRGGSTLLSANALPSAVIGVQNEMIIKDRFYGKTKLLAVQCNVNLRSSSYPQVTATFVNDPTNGKWGVVVPTAVPGTMIGCAEIAVIATGFGGGKKILSQTSVPAAGDTKSLQVVIASPLNDTNVTGLDVYARFYIGWVAGSPIDIWGFVGHIDVVANPTGTFTFSNGPLHTALNNAATVDIWTATAMSATSASTPGGLLIPGKTYYVSLLGQRFNDNNVYASASTTWANSTYLAITVQPGHNSINIQKTAGGTPSTMLAIGLHPQTMIPYGIISNDATFSYNILDMPRNQLGTVLYAMNGATTYKLAFRSAAFDNYDMLARLNGSTWEVIAMANRAYTESHFDYPSYANSVTPFWTTAVGYARGADWSWDQYSHSGQELLFMTPKSNLGLGLAPGYRQSPIVQCDGFAASYIEPDFGSATFPQGGVLRFFKESMMVAGGSGDAYNKVYFTRQFNPYNIGVPGAATVAQFIQVEAFGEPISAIGTYTNTTGTSGPQNQLLIGKKNSTWILTNLPTYDGATSNYNNAIMTQLSGKVGPLNEWCIANTEIGTVMVSETNVWLVRESGEPSPLGDAISYLLKPENPALSVTTTYWNAVYHDGHIKLSYASAGQTVPDSELWLDIRKMKAMKGQPCWMGPHTGRQIKYSMVEDQFNDTIIPKRICVDATNKRWYQADREDAASDFGVDIACDLETRNYPLQDPNLNKLFTRTYWKVKADQSFNATETTTTMSDSGEIAETKTLTFPPLPGYTGGTYATFLACRAKTYSFFPTARLRGETVRKRFQYSGPVNFAISGFSLFYRIEGRRI